ncbi:10006_t:CDS:2 [Scutellospora calospora]|uniref:10006_t:CDS:1 n=1 Tax=Scutellospora calospora TaxID=85575 RepID=A0ACA9KYN6_9GLOM|nr:10006_t:CDS:2 [Scutellospora calospora]
MATNTTSHHLTPSPSTLGYMNSEKADDPITPISIQRNPPSPRTQSKSILTVALQKAQKAVQFDEANNVPAALEAYKETVELLSQVIVLETEDDDASNVDNEPDISEYILNNVTSQYSNNSSPIDITSNRMTGSNGQKSISNDDLIDQNSSIQYNENTSTPNANVRTDSSIRANGGMKNGIDYHVNSKDNFKNGDYIARPKRLSVLSHKSTFSTSTTKSWTSSKSLYEITANGTKSITDASDIAESVTSSDDVDFSSDDFDSSANCSDAQNFEISDTKYDTYLSDINQDSSIKSSSSSISPPSALSQESFQKDSSSPSLTIKESISLSETEKLISSSSARIFTPPPPPKIAPPTSSSTSPNLRSDGVVPAFHTPSLPSSSPQNTSILEKKVISPKVSPSSMSSSVPLPRSKSDDEDDKASEISTSTESVTPSSPPITQSSIEKLFNKALPNTRRPTPLPLAQQNNSRIITGNIPSNNSPILDSPNFSRKTPRRTISNPGNAPKKNTTSRFFNQSHSSPSPGTPGTPWTNSLSFISTPLGSPGLAPPSSTFRSDSPVFSTRTVDSGYASCLVNPYPNPLIYDEDTDTPLITNSGISELPPNDVHLKPFWLMRLLERTMTTGGYLTQKLYIPRNLWLQGHAKLTAIDAKVSSCDVVLNCLVRLSKTSVDDMDVLVKVLEGIEPIIEGLQNSLARKLSYVETTNGKGRQSTSSLMNWGSKLSRGLDKMGISNATIRSEEANEYVDVLLKVFQNVDVVEKYIRHFCSMKAPYNTNHSKIVTRLYKFSDYFGNVLCRFVMKDLGILADKYIKKGSHWITE